MIPAKLYSELFFICFGFCLESWAVSQENCALGSELPWKGHRLRRQKDVDSNSSLTQYLPDSVSLPAMWGKNQHAFKVVLESILSESPCFKHICLEPATVRSFISLSPCHMLTRTLWPWMSLLISLGFWLPVKQDWIKWSLKSKLQESNVYIHGSYFLFVLFIFLT